MKAITLWQPWATLVVLGEKGFETRSWATNYRGELAIHAAKRWDADLRRVACTDPFRKVLQKYSMVPEQLPRGSVIGIVRLTNCLKIRAETTLLLTEQEIAFGDWMPGRFVWVLDDFGQIEPVPARGWPGLWNWEKETIC